MILFQMKPRISDFQTKSNLMNTLSSYFYISITYFEQETKVLKSFKTRTKELKHALHKIIYRVV